MSAPTVHLLLLIAQVCFASMAVAGRMAMQGPLGPSAIVLARVAGAALVFALIAWQRGVLRVSRKDLPALMGCAFLGIAANQQLFVQGLARSTATNASLVTSTAPVFTVILVVMLGRERARPRRIAGIACALIAAAVLVGVERFSLASDHLLGTALLVLDAIVYGSFLVAVRSLAKRYDPLGLLASLFILALPMVAPFGIAELADTPPLHVEDVGYLAFLIAVPTIAAYGLMQVAIKHAESSVAAAYMYLQPALVTIGAWLLLDEHPTLRTALCGVAVLFGVWLAAKRD